MDNSNNNQDVLARTFIGNSEMARLMRAHDWSTTSLGDPAGWPLALRCAVQILLTSRFEMWVGWGPDVAFLYNDAYRPTLGGKHPRSLGMPTRELYPEIWDEVAPRLRRVYEHGESTWDRALLLVLHRHGYPEETYHTFSYSPLSGDDGQVEGIFCAVSEETERVISERRLGSLEALATSIAGTEQLESFFPAVAGAAAKANRDIVFSALYQLDEAGTPLPLYEDLGGAAPEPRTTWRLDTLREAPPLFAVQAPPGLPYGAWQVPATQAAVIALSHPGQDHPTAALVIGLNPMRPLDDDYASYLKLFAGQVLARWTSLEARRRLATEVAARTEERDRLRAMFKDAPSFMALLSGPGHVFELANDAYMRLVGPRPLIGLSAREALPELSGQGYFELLDRVYATGEAFVGEAMAVRIQRAPGAEPVERFVHLVYQPLFVAGRVQGIFVDGYDVTHQKNAEHALRQLNATLENHVQARTAELELALERLRHEGEERSRAEKALQRAQKMEALGALTGGVAHDFNNSLQVISANLQLLAVYTKGQPLAQKRVESALSGVERGARLASQLLSFGRRQPLEPRVVNVGRFIRGLEEMLRRTLGEGVEVETVISGGLWNTSVDPSQVENAVLNLAINARDAMDGHGRLTIEAGNAFLDADYCKQHDDVRPGQYVMIAVTDTGSGMPSEVLDRAFDPFFTTKPEGKGTGLGLSMVYGFVKQSGGHVVVYSEVGEGTTVKLYLPRSMQVENAPPPGVADGPVEGGNETVLVVEDDEEVRETAVAMLAGMGYRVLRARNADSALMVIESGVAIDVLFTDVMMPGRLRSPELARIARQRLPGIAVLFTSGYTENAIVHGGRLDEGVELLSKPYTQEALAQRIRQVLNTARQRAAPPQAPPTAAVPGRFKVLMVEDDEAIRTTAADHFRTLGHEVMEAATAGSALLTLGGQDHFDALLLDLNLPDMNGADLARAALRTRPRLGVVFASGAQPAPGHELPPGARLLLKPYDTNQLVAECEAAIRAASASEPKA
ncbi:hybrid sensor histidine kinase/response regulator [Hydrogenophaga laconesensis]|uniref:histidine kinase n=1 Tax=Hydrogenophaga laconesensis TaxID=1805971 RepID=A0ABU1V960_9BURK|nr:response regulator [Hydrogenophaga laconesensis]MDR7093996.1 signal transduction histidine kinase/DNA-binding response OmpR family regulator/PAS domain-containing protein [Hydrogenophaga laconesensis]